MGEEYYVDPTHCQAWEACASQHLFDMTDQHGHQPRYLDINREFGQEGESRGYADDATWILTASFVIFTMQSGFGLLEAGSCAPGYEVNIMMKNIIDVVFGSLAYYLVGYGISFGQPSIPFMGLGNFPADGGHDEVESGLLYSRYIFQLSFAATSTTIVSGCVAQRLRFFVYVLYSFLSIIFYSFVAHWVFDTGGWLNMRGVHDFAGAGPVHLFGGVNGLIGVLFVGPRKGRFDGSRPITDFFPSSPSSQAIGLFMLWWGWIGFNCGSTFGITEDKWSVAIRTAVTTINSAVGGAIVSIIYSLWRTEWKLVIPEHLVNGILAALVSITASCACVQTWIAFPVGAIGSLVALLSNTYICHLRIDDPVGGIGHHAVAAIWGLISVGLFADSRLPGVNIDDGLFNGGGWKQLGRQMLEIVSIIAWGIVWATSFFYLVGICLSRDCKDPRKGLRVHPKEEDRGADWFLHGVADMQAFGEELKASITGLDLADPNGLLSDHSDPALCRSLHQKRHGRKASYTSRTDLYKRSGIDQKFGGFDSEATLPSISGGSSKVSFSEVDEIYDVESDLGSLRQEQNLRKASSTGGTDLHKRSGVNQEFGGFENEETLPTISEEEKIHDAESEYQRELGETNDEPRECLGYEHDFNPAILQALASQRRGSALASQTRSSMRRLQMSQGGVQMLNFFLSSQAVEEQGFTLPNETTMDQKTTDHEEPGRRPGIERQKSVRRLQIYR